MTEQEEAERRHCEEVAKAFEPSIRGVPVFQRVEDLADLLAYWRADARRQALEEAAEVADLLTGEAREHALVLNRQGRRDEFAKAASETAALEGVAPAIRALASPKP